MAEPAAERWARVQAVFERAANLGGTARTAYLDDACAGDTDLRREIDELLAAESDVEGFLDGAAAPPAEDERIDIPRYDVRERIGAGGMGIVYRAERTGDFEQVVAVKVLKRGMDTDDIVRRFRLERQTLANLSHPNIAQVFDGGRTADGRPYLVMELVAGRPIDAYCREQELDVRARIELFGKVCDAVAHAHRNLIVHRDLKPSNVLVDEHGEPKLLDFGVAKVLDPSAAGASLAVTATGERLLTPRYASPEQIRGEAITTATDVYALGVVLYELLAGRSPYDLKTTSAASIERVVCDTDPARPSTAVAPDDATTAEHTRRLRRTLRGDLDLIVLKALRKEPERRYESVDALHEDLRRWLRGEPVSARPDSWSYRATRFVRRNRVGVAAATAVGVVVLGALVLSLVLLGREADARREADDRADDAAWEAYVAQVNSALSLTVDEARYFRYAEAARSLEDIAPERRGDWVWDHLQGRHERSVWTTRLPSSPDYNNSPHHVRFDPEGRRLAVAQFDGRLSLLDAASGVVQRTIDTGHEHISVVAWSPDGRTLATVGFRDGTVRLWEPDTGTQRAILDDGHEELRTAAYSADGRHLLVGGTSSLSRWELNSPARVTWTVSSDRVIRHVAWCADGSEVVVGHPHGLTVRDAGTGERLGLIDTHPENLLAMRVVGAEALTLHQRGHVCAINLPSRSLTRTAVPHRRFSTTNTAGTIGPRGRLAALEYANGVDVWTPGGSKLIPVVGMEESTLIESMDLSPGARRIAVVQRGARKVRVFDLGAAKSYLAVNGPGKWRRLAFDASSTLAACGSRQGNVDVIDIATGLTVRRIERQDGRDVRGVAFVGAGADRIVLIARDVPGRKAARDVIEWWDLRREERLTQRPCYTGIRMLAVDPEGERVAYANGLDTVVIADAVSGETERELTGFELRPWCVAFSPDGTLVAVGTGRSPLREHAEGRALVWDVATGALVRVLATDADGGIDGESLTDIVVFDDGRVIACGHTPDIFDWPAGETTARRHRCRARVGRIDGLALSPDGAYLAPALPIGSTRLWDTTRMEAVAMLHEGLGGMHDIQFTPDGRFVAAVLYTAGDLRLWDRRPPRSRVAAAAVRFWHDELDGDWDAIADVVATDPMLDDAWRAEATAIVRRLTARARDMPAE